MGRIGSFEFEREIIGHEELTFAEKVISLRSVEGRRCQAGDIAVLKVDLAMAQDSTGPLAIRSLDEMGVSKLWDPSKIMLVLDHTYPPADEKVANLHAMIRNFAFRHGCLLVEGNISHQYILEEYAAPGMVIFGADSHTCQAGCVGAFATGVGSTEMAAIWAFGDIWVKVPETYRINLTGSLPMGVYARDIILNFIGTVGEDGGAYKALEWTGETARKLSVDSRACICNNSMECGAKISVFEPDEVTKQYLTPRGREPLYETHPGTRAEYGEVFNIECDSLEPLCAAPDNPDNVKTVGESAGTPIDEAFIGSSTNGRIEDLEVAAQVLNGRKVKKGTRCVITPASMKVYSEAIRKGLAQRFIESGAIFTNPTCGACVGTHLGVLGVDEVCVSSSPRNYIGRMGSSSAKIYLASPATVAASAVEGKITDPRGYL